MSRTPLGNEIDRLTILNKELLEALKEISIGRGPYSLDPLKHADNCIECMKSAALEAIRKAELHTG